jgi:hypothetical protein
MLDLNQLDAIWHARLRHDAHNLAAWNHPGAARRLRPEQLLNEDVANRLPRVAGSPSASLPRESLSRPPVRVISGQVQRDLISANALRFSDTVCGHHHSLRVSSASSEKSKVLAVKLAPQWPFRRVKAQPLEH